MIYKRFKDIKLSALGFGTMRLPVKNGVYSDIDEVAAGEMFDYAISHGVNYFDTAWGYHDGESERVVGRLLSKYPRDKFYLASKFPGYDLANMDKVESIFEAQLEKCKTDYFDFYLFHNVCEMNVDSYLDEKFGIFEYLKKAKGKRADKAPRFFGARRFGLHAQVPRKVRRVYGVRTAPNKLHRLDVPERA